MTPLPPPDVLAGLVSNVTQTLLGISFVPDKAPSTALQWRTALLPIAGARPITVGLASDEQGCRALSAAMFSCTPETVDTSMVEDALRELTNMTAGLVKSALALDQKLGLPQVVREHEFTAHAQPPRGQAVVLKANGLGLFLWVCEGIHTKN